MKALVGTVKSNIDFMREGVLRVKFTDLFDNQEQLVTYTSPFFRVNGGGMVAIPEDEDQILVFWNENSTPGEKKFYYISTIVTSKTFKADETPNPDYVPLRSNDSKANLYNEDSKPATIAFTNQVGAGLLVHRDYQEGSISNNVTLKAESGDEINIGPLGFQVRNPQGDSIVLAGTNGDDFHAAQSFALTTESSQKYKCTSSDITMKIEDGGDINILNNSTGAFGIEGVGGKWSGNIRLKSSERNIDLAALGESSNVNIITQGATIQVDSLGTVKISSANNIQFESAANINLNAAQGVNIFGGTGVQIGSNGAVNANGSTVSLNGVPVTFLPTSPSKDDRAKPVPGNAGTPPPGVTLTPNDYSDPLGIGFGGAPV